MDAKKGMEVLTKYGEEIIHALPKDGHMVLIVSGPTGKEEGHYWIKAMSNAGPEGAVELMTQAAERMAEKPPDLSGSFEEGRN